MVLHWLKMSIFAMTHAIAQVGRHGKETC
jgi:hypothetical protein